LVSTKDLAGHCESNIKKADAESSKRHADLGERIKKGYGVEGLHIGGKGGVL
jgi:hypothetical protein